MFKQAEKKGLKARIAIAGPSGSGKTYTALTLASYLALKEQKGQPACIDTERGSASKYSDKFSFLVCELEEFQPKHYIQAINGAIDAGVSALVIDSLSHEWREVLKMVEQETLRSPSKNSYYAWGKVTPIHNELIDAILKFPGHIIVTMRSKTEYITETNDKGKSVPKKVGLAPVQRDDVEFEFDVVIDMTPDNQGIVGKTRCSALSQKIFNNPGKDLGDILWKWLNDDSTVNSSSDRYVPAYKEVVKESVVTPQQPVKVKTETENFPKPPCIWDSWKSLDGAINWAWSIIPDADKDFLVNVFKGFPKTEDKTERGKLWVATINEFHQSGNYKKVQPEPEPQETELEPAF